MESGKIESRPHVIYGGRKKESEDIHFLPGNVGHLVGRTTL